MIQICTECLSTTADMMLGPFCFNGKPHQFVDAQVTDCPFTRRDKRGTFRAQWRRQANRLCDDEDHHYGMVAHVKLPSAITENQR